MQVKLEIKKTDSSSYEELKVISFSFKKNLYTSYTTLSVSFIADNSDYSSVCEIMLTIDNHTVHHGLIDSFEVFEKNGVKMGKAVSRGFTSLLLQNQIEPGLKSNISLNSLIDSYYNLNYVTHEDNSNIENYIYVQGRSTMWDGVVTLAYKLCGTYPFIESTNCIRITPKPAPTHFSFSDSDIVSSGLIHDFSSLISNFDMPDIEGNYGTFTLEDSDTIAKKIVRHKYIDFDREFLYNPQEALVFRNKVAGKARFCRYIEYSGYSGEDLTDTVSFNSVDTKKIGLINIRGTGKGIFTKLGVYYDNF